MSFAVINSKKINIELRNLEFKVVHGHRC